MGKIITLLFLGALVTSAQITSIPSAGGGSADGVEGKSALTEVGNIPRVSAAGILGLSKLSCTLGVCTVYDDTATTGATTLNIKPGAGQSTTGLFNVWLNTAGSTPGLHVASDGKVGLGVASPSTALDINGSLSFTGAGGTGNIAKDAFNATGFDFTFGNTSGYFRMSTAYLKGAKDQLFQFSPSGSSYGIIESAYGLGLVLQTCCDGDHPVIFGTERAERARISSAGLFGIGTASPDRLFHVELADAATNAVSYASRISHTTSGTAAAGFGVGTEFELEGTEANKVAADDFVAWTTPTTGAEDAYRAFRVVKAGTLTEVIRLVKDIGVQFATGTEPTCEAATRGTVIYVAGGAGVADTFRLCAKDASNNYAWTALY